MHKVLFVFAAMMLAAPVAAHADTWKGTNSDGQVFKMNFRSDGVVYGISTARNSAGTLRDSGHWWNKGAERCIQWNHWRHGRTRCGMNGGVWE